MAIVPVPGLFHSVAPDGKLAKTTEIFDDAKNKFQSELNNASIKGVLTALALVANTPTSFGVKRDYGIVFCTWERSDPTLQDTAALFLVVKDFIYELHSFGTQNFFTLTRDSDSRELMLQSTAGGGTKIAFIDFVTT